MNCVVCIKQVPDTETKIQIKPDGSGVDATAVKWIISPYDEFAIEEALRTKEKTPGSTVTVISAGPARVKEAIRTALAMGADAGVHLDTPEDSDNFIAAKTMAQYLSRNLNQNAFDLIFTGKEAIDDGSAQVSQLMSEFLNIPCVTVVLGLEWINSRTLKCKREVEGGACEIVECQIPAIVAAQKGLNEPRYASLPNIMKARKKEISTIPMLELGVKVSDQKIRLKNFQLPPPKQAGRKIEGPPEEQAKKLVQLLKDEAKVISL